jgi:RecB family endonuclease NucS
MLTDEQLEELAAKVFSSSESLEEMSNRLLTMNSEHVDELRVYFVNELLYSISIGFTKYAKPNEVRDSAILLFCNNVSLLPKSQLYFRAVSAFFQHKNEQCLLLIDEYLREDAKKHPDRPVDEFFIVDCFFEPLKEAFAGFWTSLGELIKKYPHHPHLPALCGAIDKYYTCKTDEEALDLLIACHQRNNESILLKELIGHTYYSMKMWHNAVAYFEQVEDNRVFFRNDTFFFMMAWCYGKIKDHNLEEQFYREVLENNPQDVDATNNLGYSLYAQKRYVEAKAIFEKCMALDPNYQYAQNNYVRVLIALGKYKDAKTFVNQGHKVSSVLKRKVEHLENTNKGKVRGTSKEALQEDIPDSSSVQQAQIDLGVRRQQFSSEKLLEDELTARIEAGMEVFGTKLKLFRRKGLYGRQFIIPIGRLDLLCEDADGNLYVIELKKDSGYDDAYQQTANYLDWFEKSEYAKGKKVYGIICLNSPTNALIQKVRNDKRMKLFEYAISYTEI